MDTDRVIAVFAVLSGLSEDEVREQRYLCEMSMDEITERLPEGKSCGGREEYAAAALAYYRYVLWCITDGELNQIKVGELSSKRNGSAEIDAAEKLCRQAFSDIADLLEHDGFVFSVID